ncbi:hypothetical protein MST27_04960 [Pseudomonas sp. PS1]|uniref:Uncharacterized protein n=1 Tax=Stutzerimonas marianensis TaxID=2929513 RepID=A0A9X1W0B9_9GAMM|nr:hypothetical protein [Pseudomonas marianensis]MCJ0972716.1 hypothetical protein [Pseudomonas marianensis]
MSKEVKRFNFDVDKFGSPRAYESEHGRWMKRDDYESLLAERDAARMRVKELDLLFGRYLLAMKAAVIDADQRGDEEGMRWIYNSLAGPGELPAEDEIDAQAFFDREIKPIDEAMAELFTALQGAQP